MTSSPMYIYNHLLNFMIFPSPLPINTFKEKKELVFDNLH